MGLGVMMSMVKTFIKVFTIPYKTHSRDALAANHPRLIAKDCHSVHLRALAWLY